MTPCKSAAVIVIALVSLVASAQVFSEYQLDSNNPTKGTPFIFTVNTTKHTSTVSFSVTVAPRDASKLLPRDVTKLVSADARAMLFDGTGEIHVMQLYRDEPHAKEYRYTFEIATNYLAYSQFVFRYSNFKTIGNNDDDVDSVYFFLRDFSHEGATNTATEPLKP